MSDFDDSFENDITTRASSETSAKPTKEESASVFTLKYYQKFFDVDANIVLDRIIHMMYAPKSVGSGYLEEKINKNPDFYGPFWIVVSFELMDVCI